MISTYKEAKELKQEVERLKQDSLKSDDSDKWMWVKGYKGTDANMCCRGFQYEMNKQFDMEDDNIKVCESGFHMCLKKRDVFKYYSIGKGNRFFEVSALVRREDYLKYGHIPRSSSIFYAEDAVIDKLVAKSIFFSRELTVEEIFDDTRMRGELPKEYLELALKEDFESARNKYETDTLVQDEYAESLAKYLVTQGKYEVAHAIASQPCVSMDTKMNIIFSSSGTVRWATGAAGGFIQ